MGEAAEYSDEIVRLEEQLAAKKNAFKKFKTPSLPLKALNTLEKERLVGRCLC
jgi:hypothetical protein